MYADIYAHAHALTHTCTYVYMYVYVYVYKNVHYIYTYVKTYMSKETYIHGENHTKETCERSYKRDLMTCSRCGNGRRYGVPRIIRLLQILGLFCRISSLL